MAYSQDQDVQRITRVVWCREACPLPTRVRVGRNLPDFVWNDVFRFVTLTPGRIAISWLLLGWVTVCLQRSRNITNSSVNSALIHPSGVGNQVPTCILDWR